MSTTSIKICQRCGSVATDKHHIFNGAYRDKSEEDGMYIYLCRKCHRYIHDNSKVLQEYKKKYQQTWMAQNNKTIDDFIKRYGKNYLEVSE